MAQIDMNGQYTSDRFKNAFAETITLGRAEGYDLSITWNEEFVISPQGSDLEFDCLHNVWRM